MSGMVESYERRAHRRQPIDEWLRARPDRCPGCGFHVATQGHGKECAPVAPPPTDGAITADEWAIFTDALRQVVRDGEVHQRDVRPLVRGRIEPNHIGLCYRRAIKDGLIREVRREQSNDTVGRNTNKWEPVYEWRAAA